MTEVVDVTSCGAKGDDVTDDTAAIQAAINTCGPVRAETKLFDAS